MSYDGPWVCIGQASEDVSPPLFHFSLSCAIHPFHTQCCLTGKIIYASKAYCQVQHTRPINFPVKCRSLILLVTEYTTNVSNCGLPHSHEFVTFRGLPALKTISYSKFMWLTRSWHILLAQEGINMALSPASRKSLMKLDNLRAEFQTKSVELQES